VILAFNLDNGNPRHCTARGPKPRPAERRGAISPPPGVRCIYWLELCIRSRW